MPSTTTLQIPDHELGSVISQASEWQSKIWQMPMTTHYSNASDGSVQMIENADTVEGMRKIIENLPSLIHNLSAAIAKRDQRIDALSDRIVELEQKMEVMVAIETNENFGKF